MNQPDVDKARVWLRAAQHVAVLTGAGMSAESGIPTFRDAALSAPDAPTARAPRGGAPVLGRPGDGPGLWSRFDAAQLASVEGFRSNPQRVWQWYAERRDGVRCAQPNAGHVALARFGERHPGRITVITQNVDDLHQRAGSAGVIRLHGDILQDGWLDACPRPIPCDTAQAAEDSPPTCKTCGNLVRPQVVWFGEMLPIDALTRAEHAADNCAVMLVVGTSGAVYPAAGLAARARRAGAKIMIVNPHASEIDDEADVLLRASAATMLPVLLSST